MIAKTTCFDNGAYLRQVLLSLRQMLNSSLLLKHSFHHM